EIEDLCFAYPVEAHPTLNHISLTVDEGQFVVICGSSGSGKTTLLRHLKPELAPVGIRSGRVSFDGSALDPSNGLASTRDASADIGMVLQNPDNQIVMEGVLQELAFSLENLGLPL